LKHSRSAIHFLLAVFLLGLFAEAVGDIRTTPHALRAGGAAVVDEQEICVFCHTPFVNISQTQSQSPPLAPKWQSAVGSGHSYTMFDDIGRLDQLSVGSQSIACLSCHDGNQAFSVSKLSFDHPYGVPYRGYTRRESTQTNQRSAPKEAAVSATHLIALDEFREPSQGVVNDRTVWWVSAGGRSTLRSRDDLPLYLRKDEGASGLDIPFIECSSCHNPHTTNRLFLRVSNEGSRLCLTCHNK